MFDLAVAYGMGIIGSSAGSTRLLGSQAYGIAQLGCRHEILFEPLVPMGDGTVIFDI